MSESNTHIDLFTKSGCLTTEALKRYHSDKLSDFEKDRVKGHLVSCELCSDALEGLQLLSDPKKYDSIVSEINANLQTTLIKDVERTQSKKFKLQNRLYYIAAAASVLILLGLFSYLKTYLNSESATQTISQLIDIEKKIIPPMPSVKTQEIIPKSEEQPQRVSKKGEPSQKETSNELLNKTEPKQKIETNQSAQKVTDEENLTYVAPLKAIRTPESIPESLAVKEIDTDVDRTSESEEYIAVDIASTQPLEYYIGGVVVYDKADEHTEPTDYSTGAGIMSGRASNHKKMNAIPQMVASESKKGKGNEKQEDLTAVEQSDFKYEEEGTSEDHFFSLGNEMPQYPGGYEALIEFLNSNLTYPKEARQKSIQGKVVISFIVEEEGEVSSVTIVHGIGGGCDEEAVRVIKLMPAWQPAYKEGNPVRVLFNMPITYKLN